MGSTAKRHRCRMYLAYKEFKLPIAEEPAHGESERDEPLYDFVVHKPQVVKQAAPTAANEELAQEFRRLAEEWENDTAFLSSVTEMSMHPAYQRIIGLGSKVLPLILRELERDLDHWFWALSAITGEDPVPPEDAGDLEKMRDAWLKLSRQRGWCDAK